MITTIKFVLYKLSLLFILTPFVLHASEYNVLTEDFAPFAYIKDGETKGLSIEIVTEILKKISPNSKIKIKPWARAYRETLQGPDTILFSMAKTKPREDLFKWVGPIVSDRVVFYKLKSSNIVVNNLEDAKKVKTILLVKDYPEHKILTKLGFQNLYSVTHPIQSLQMLLRKRGQLLPMGELAIPDLLKKADISAFKIEKTDVVLYKVDLYIALSKDINDEKVLQWQEALNELKNSHQYQEILNKYILRQ